MRALDRKLLRDSIHMRSQLGAIALVVMAAVATYVTMRGSYEGLITARDAAYAEYRFAHVFAQVKRAPMRMTREIALIPGVVAVDARIVGDVPLDVPRLSEPATGRIVSYDGTLNLLHIRRGRLFDPMRSDEAVASELFARANHLETGETIGAVLNGRWERITVVGIGTTPEFLNEVSGAGVFPDHERFGVLWMPRRAAAAAFSMQGAFNNVALSLARGADETRVIADLDRMLARYGATGAYGRSEQQSHQFMQSEISQDRITATTIPAIFLLVGAFLIHMVLSRLVASQREQIAILKAFGYSSGAIALHFLGFALIVVAAGALAGIPIGIYLGRGLTNLYREFFNFPQLRFVVSPAAIAISISASAIAAAAAALTSAFRGAAVPPAQGMQGERPPSFHATAFEPLHEAMPSAARMIARSLERRPLRAFFAMIGIAFAAMILVVGRYSFDALDEIVAIHFREAQRDDVTVTFVEPRAPRTAYDLAHLPGVQRVEVFRAVPIRVLSGYRSRHVALIGIDRDAELRRLVAADGSITPIPAHGIVLTQKLAEILGVGRGATVHVETLEGRRIAFEAPVVATVAELVGIAAYIDRSELALLMREDRNVSGAWLSIDPQSRERLNHILKRLPVIAGAAYREAMLKSFLETAAKSLRTSTAAIIFSACVIAFAVVYNSARIALSERGRDLATLRVLGFSTREVATLLLGEQVVLTLTGVPIGFLLGRLIAMWLVHLFDTEQFRLPLVIAGWTYAYAALVIAGATLLSAAAVWRRISTLDLVEVLKTRE